MHFFKCRVLLLVLIFQSIVGCGGGGGGGVSSDTVAPIINVFTMPTTSDSQTSLTVPISNLSASDAVGVTGYLVTESATSPFASASDWSSTPPTSFTFTSGGFKTAYAWAKDAAGNVSSSRSVTVTFTALKTATLKFSSTSTNPSEFIAGFLLSVTLPTGSFLPTDSVGGPLPGVVVFAGGKHIADDFFNKSLLVLNSQYVFSGIQVSEFVNLGDFITILVTVPVGYVPNGGDISYSFVAKSPPPSGASLSTVFANFTFN